MGKFRAFLIKILSGQEPPPSHRAIVLDLRERVETLERSHADLHAVYLKWRGYAAQAKQQLAIDAGNQADTPQGIPAAATSSKDDLRKIARQKLGRF